MKGRRLREGGREGGRRRRRGRSEPTPAFPPLGRPSRSSRPRCRRRPARLEHASWLGGSPSREGVPGRRAGRRGAERGSRALLAEGGKGKLERAASLPLPPEEQPTPACMHARAGAGPSRHVVGRRVSRAASSQATSRRAMKGGRERGRTARVGRLLALGPDLLLEALGLAPGGGNLLLDVDGGHGGGTETLCVCGCVQVGREGRDGQRGESGRAGGRDKTRLNAPGPPPFVRPPGRLPSPPRSLAQPHPDETMKGVHARTTVEVSNFPILHNLKLCTLVHQSFPLCEDPGPRTSEVDPAAGRRVRRSAPTRPQRW